MASEPGPPKVFISHASEDKAFVLDFAARLRARGIDVWLDRWEILPGDSFVRKIFDEGLGQAKAVIVVISKASAEKPWVREELDVAVVRKINRASKLIPVIIDDSRVPNCLQATLWERIADPKKYDESLDRIISSILGRTDKPPLGEQPEYARKEIVTIGDLTPTDSQVLQTASELCLEELYDLQFFESDVVERLGKLGVSEEAVRDSVRVLEHRGYLKRELEDNMWVTEAGFEEYLKAHRPDYEALLKRFASLVVNEQMWEGAEIEASLKLPRVLVDHVVEGFAKRKWILVARFAAGRWEVVGEPAPEMKRWLAS